MKKLLFASAIGIAMAMSSMSAHAVMGPHTLIVVAAMPGQAQPQVLKDGFVSLLECNNYAIDKMADYDNVWCIALDKAGNPVQFTPRTIKYIYPYYKRQPDRVIELRRR